jgi:hypothetical protein
MSDRDPSPFELLAASIRDNPGRWLPLGRDSMGEERIAELTSLILGGEGMPPAASAMVGPHQTRRTADLRHRDRRKRLVLLAAMTMVLTLCGSLLLGTRAPSAQAAVRAAAEILRESQSLEARLTTWSPEHRLEATLRTDGDAFHLVTETTYADGHEETSEQTVVGGYIFETIGGATTRTPVAPGNAPASFVDSSAAVVEATVTGADGDAIESKTTAGSSTQYDISPGPEARRALSRLKPNQLAWFELEDPTRVETLRLWITGDVIRELEIRSGSQTSRIRFGSLDKDTEIVAPPGPYEP